MNLFKQLFKRVIMWLFKQNIFKLRRIIEEVITYFSVIFYSHIGCMLFSYFKFRLTVLPFSTSSVILVTDNVTKAAPGYSDGTNKAYWDGNVVSQFQACSVLSIVLNSFTGGCLYFTTSGPAQASITVQTSIDGATWTNNTGSFTSPRCDIPTPTVTTRFRMQSVNAPLVYSNEIYPGSFVRN
jgi:hypothetical protein